MDGLAIFLDAEQAMEPTIRASSIGSATARTGLDLLTRTPFGCRFTTGERPMGQRFICIDSHWQFDHDGGGTAVKSQ